VRLDSDYIFVYGTLRRSVNLEKHALMSPYCHFVSTGFCRGYLYEIDNYPGLVLDEEGMIIKGEIYQITDKSKLFNVLDEYEGCTEDDEQPHEYRRELIHIESEEGNEYACWVYIFQWDISLYPKLKVGDYEAYTIT